MEEDGSQTGLLGKQLLGTVGVLGGMVSDEITIAAISFHARIPDHRRS